ncbi:hypothetical protein [Oribacterium sp. NK2B42]|uniref:hypothetical protein n=1 Tax=Oribacterium sp. NK2B42 TaxID=689781 RepID=UPI000492DBBF|nr:hypothetical protein [Oribacterium sp. NK2B42]
MGLSVYYAVIRLLKFVLIPMVTVVILYRKRKQKLIGSLDLLMYFVLAMVGNVVGTRLGLTIIGKFFRSIVGIELPYNKCYVLAGMILAVFVLPKLLELFSLFSSKLFHMSDREVVKNTLDYYFLFVISVVCFGTQIGLTTFYFNLPYEVYKNLYIVSCLAAAFKVMMLLTDKDSAGSISDIHKSITDGSSQEVRGLTANRKKVIDFIKETSFRNKNLLLSIPVALVFYLAFPSEHYLYQQFLAPLIIGCVGIKVQKILYAAIIPVVVVIPVMIMAGLGGAIYSMSYFYRDMRSCWGHIYPTDFGTAIIFIAITIWVMFRDVPDVFFLIPAAVSYFISTYITRSFTSEYITVLFLVVILARILGREVLEKRGKLKWIPKINNVLMLSAFPVFGMMMLFLVFAYVKEKSWALALDTLMHARLRYPAEMYAEYGIHAFGTYFDMIGAGGSVIANGGQYNFLDSTYPQIFIRYGWVTYITACGLWVWTTWRAIKAGHRRMAVAMALFSVDFIMEHHWYELCYNPFIIMAFADFTWEVGHKAINMTSLNGWTKLRKNLKGDPAGGTNVEIPNRLYEDGTKSLPYRAAFWGVFFVLLVAWFLILPVIFSWMRTIFHGCGLYGGGEKGKIVFAIITVFLGATLLVIWNLSKIVALFIINETLLVRETDNSHTNGDKSRKSYLNDSEDTNKDKSEADNSNSNKEIVSNIDVSIRSNIMFLLVGVVVLFTFAAAGNSLINKVGAENADRIEQNRKVLEIAVAHADGKVYVDMLPEAYIRRIRGLSRSYMNGHDYGRYSNATVLTDADWDSACLTGEGFLYLQISENDAIYTNDSGVIEALREEGYVLKGYNSYVHQVDMENMARMNDVEETEDGLLLEGIEHQIIHGPYLELASGKFTAEFELKLLNPTGDINKKVCGLRVASYYGQSVKAEVNVYESDFDEDGKVTYKVPFWGNGQGYEFLVFTEDGVKCLVSSITYARTPDMDIHIIVDGEGRTIHEEYYDMEGNPKQMSEGHYGMEYAYDDNDLPIMRRYLGIDFEPVVISNGYAEVRREYDINKRLIKESYYGVDGEPVNLPAGQHSVVKDYDFKGNVIKEAYYGVDGEPVIYNNNFHVIIRDFDEKNRCIHEEYYGTDMEPIALAGGYAGIDREYDEEGNVIRQVFLSTDMEPVVIDKGYAEWRKEYDGNKCVLMECYYGADGEKLLLNDKYFMIRRTFDEKKQCTSEKYYGLDEEPILIPGGYAGYEQSQDDRGNVVHFTYLGLEGEPVIADSGFSIWHRTYNEKKQVIREEYYDVDDQKMTRPGGQFAVEHEYDEAGNSINDMYFGLSDERILVNGSFWKVQRTYNENKKNVHEEYFGTDGEPILVGGKYAMIDFVYDDSGKLVKKILKDIAGQVVEEQDV